jgi:hypothetical protein
VNQPGVENQAGERKTLEDGWRNRAYLWRGVGGGRRVRSSRASSAAPRLLVARKRADRWGRAERRRFQFQELSILFFVLCGGKAKARRERRGDVERWRSWPHG